MTFVAVDIGGANLKAADGRGGGVSRAFPLWRRPGDLAGELAALLAELPPAERIVATMTGELADCYRTKADGVRAIVAALQAIAAGRELQIYRTDGAFVPPDAACARPLLAAASNWHALAAFAGRYVQGESGLLVDIGSTTCDLVPIERGAPAPRGWIDPERLALGELVYTGVERSPVCAVSRALPWGGSLCPVAHELFATTWDAYLMTGDLPEEAAATHTADGRPATREAAHERLARAICADRDLFTLVDALAAARQIAADQLALIGASLQRVVERLQAEVACCVVSGEGEFLARRAIATICPTARVVSLGERLGPRLSRVAPAHALAVLAHERAASREVPEP